jgi:hypothetical protein
MGNPNDIGSQYFPKLTSPQIEEIGVVTADARKFGKLSIL